MARLALCAIAAGAVLCSACERPETAVERVLSRSDLPAAERRAGGPAEPSPPAWPAPARVEVEGPARPGVRPTLRPEIQVPPGDRYATEKRLSSPDFYADAVEDARRDRAAAERERARAAAAPPRAAATARAPRQPVWTAATPGSFSVVERYTPPAPPPGAPPAPGAAPAPAEAAAAAPAEVAAGGPAPPAVPQAPPPWLFRRATGAIGLSGAFQGDRHHGLLGLSGAVQAAESQYGVPGLDALPPELVLGVVEGGALPTSGNANPPSGGPLTPPAGAAGITGLGTSGGLTGLGAGTGPALGTLGFGSTFPRFTTAAGTPVAGPFGPPPTTGTPTAPPTTPPATPQAAVPAGGAAPASPFSQPVPVIRR